MYVMSMGIGETEQRELAAAARLKGLGVGHVRSPSELKQRLAPDEPAPLAVFAPADPGLGTLAAWLRADPQRMGIPLIALVACPTDAAFSRAFAAGADDVVAVRDRLAVERRIERLLRSEVRPRPGSTHGLALIAAGEDRQRRTLGQTLRHAGFDVAFASENRELIALSRGEQLPALVVATPDFPPLGGAAALRCARTATGEPTLPGLVIDGELDVDALLTGAGRDRLAFLASEAMRRVPAMDQRRSERVLHGTLCSFRQPGVMQPTFGFTRDLSAEGLFVRTLDAPARGTEVWVELRTVAGTPVHLRGHVVWRREGGSGGSTTPPGFGMEIDPERTPAADLRRYVEGHARLLQRPEELN
jgi:CheY-like chemotaxis protein